MRKFFKLLVLFGTITTISLANGVGIGFGTISPMYQVENKYGVFPYVDFEYNKFFIKSNTNSGVKIGYKALEEDRYILSLYGIPYGGFEVKNRDMKDGYKGIDDRDSMFVGGVELVYYPNYFDATTSISTEFGENGGSINFSLGKSYQFGENFTLVPTLSCTYYNNEMVDYYFGVEPYEVNNRLIKNSYKGSGAYKIGVGMLGNYTFNESISLFGFTGVSKLSSEISNSPLVENDFIYLFGTGVVYTF